jgi:hypothetical protein
VKPQVCGKKILIDQILIHKQLGVSCEGIVDSPNATLQEGKLALKKIVEPHAFVKNEQRNVLRMKEEFHPRFVAILQIIYQCE